MGFIYQYDSKTKTIQTKASGIINNDNVFSETS